MAASPPAGPNRVIRSKARHSPTVAAVLTAAVAFIASALPFVPDRYKPIVQAFGGLCTAAAALLVRNAALNAADQAANRMPLDAGPKAGDPGTAP